MPQEPVAVTVTLIDAPSGKFTVSAKDSPSVYTGLGEYNVGDEVTIGYTGSYELTGSTVKTADGQNVSFTSGVNNVKFTMPAANVVVTFTWNFE